ncbi:MAG: hypothetical protein J6A01_05310 [Proteobacteria bacterium]|nr:hypothetical protein [Pseudomonadota bacterium]
MKTNRLLVSVCMVSVCCLYACSNDSELSISNLDGSPAAACESNDDCAKGKYCHESKCRNPVKAGKACLEDVPCASGTECVEGICKKTDSGIEEPTPPGDPVEPQTCETTGCEDGKVCFEGDCIDPVTVGGSCNDSVPCEAGSRCVNDVCLQWRQAGEPCNDYVTEEMCDESSLICNDNQICVPFPQKGDSCAGNLMDACVAGTACVNEICVVTVGEGAACSVADVCESPFSCIGGFCRTTSEIGGQCDNVNAFCSEGLVCQGGVCLKNYGECQTNTDCNADSYCCVMDSCDTKNVCFPYGEGPGGTYDPQCKYQLVPGQFEASIQCEWLGNPSDGVATESNQIMSTIMVADLPFDSGGASEVVAVTFSPQVIRIFNGENCALHQSIVTNYVEALSNLALADLDNDGKIEIVGASSHLAAWHWDDATGKYVQYWVNSSELVSNGWGGPSIHDLNDDGFPEIISGSKVFDGRTGKLLNAASSVPSAEIPTLGDVDNDGQVELLSGKIWAWDKNSNVWKVKSDISIGGGGMSHTAYADFGTPNADGSFNFAQKDGIAEVVSVNGSGGVSLTTLQGKILMQATMPDSSMWSAGGPPNIGDFDGDGMPEIGVAGHDSYVVFDPQCTSASVPGCQGQYYLWKSISQDNSSGVTGSVTFDFDSDGRMEVVYGDECFTRVYDGQTGEVLFSSYRTSNTAYESPTVVDVDHDMSAEIIMGSDSIAPGCPLVDPNHHGVKCKENADCYSGKCVAGYCRCNSDNECNWQYDSKGVLLDEYSCTTPLAPQSASDGYVCRAKHPSGIKRPGFRIMRDRLDRWASSRFIWNQHAYSVTNINDDGTVPRTSQWKQNFLDPTLNNYRQNAQGKLAAGYAPDITGRLDEANACVLSADNRIKIGGTLCNRGTKDVGSKLPATFYLGNPADNNILCTSYTDSNVVSGECRRVECEVSNQVSGMITMVVNDNGMGGRTTVECDTNNNTDTITIQECVQEIN